MVTTTARAETVRPSRRRRPWTRRGAGVVAAHSRQDAACTRRRHRSVIYDQELGDLGLLDLEVGLGFEDLAHFEAVGLLVTLGAGRPDGGAARGVEQTELDADGVGDLGHDAAESVDLADDVSLGDAADGGVAGHLRDEVGVEGEEGGAQSHARGGHGGFAAGMTGSDDGDIEMFGERHGARSKTFDSYFSKGGASWFAVRCFAR